MSWGISFLELEACGRLLLCGFALVFDCADESQSYPFFPSRALTCSASALVLSSVSLLASRCDFTHLNAAVASPAISPATSPGKGWLLEVELVLQCDK